MADPLYNFLQRAFFFGGSLWVLNVGFNLYKADPLEFWHLLRVYAFQGLVFATLLAIVDFLRAD